MTTIGGYPATIRVLPRCEYRHLPVHHDAGLFRVLQGEERKWLWASLKAGYDEASPIVVWAQTGEVVDGRNRRDLAAELELHELPVAFVDFPDERAVTSFIVGANLARRHLRLDQQAALAARLVRNGASVRQAAELTGASKSAVQRAAVAAEESGVPDGTPAEHRKGRDGKTYPARKPKAHRLNRTTELERIGLLVEQVQQRLDTLLELDQHLGRPLPAQAQAKAAHYASQAHAIADLLDALVTGDTPLYISAAVSAAQPRTVRK